jgi:hypothetical protein
MFKKESTNTFQHLPFKFKIQGIQETFKDLKKASNSTMFRPLSNVAFEKVDLIHNLFCPI